MLAVPEIRIQSAFLYEDVPADDESEALFVPWAYNLVLAERETRIYLRCRCGTWSETLGALHDHLLMLPPGDRRLMANYVGGANDKRGDTPKRYAG